MLLSCGASSQPEGVSMIVEYGTLVVAADGGGAVVYRNASREGAASLEIVEIHNADSKTFTRAIDPDVGEHYAAPASGKVSVAGPDYHEQGERQFATRLATWLDELIGRHEHGKDQPGVILFASPRFLGSIRSDYSARVKSALKVEVGKDLRDASSKQIEHALAKLDHA